MSIDDRARWDERYRTRTHSGPRCPELFAPYVDLFPTTGIALDLACGPGAGTLWLGQRGLEAVGVDVSPVAVAVARNGADRLGLSAQCRFDVADLDDGMPPGPPVDLLLCHRFSQPALYEPMRRRLKPGGLLAVAVLREVGAQPGRFRAPAGELATAFASVDTVASTEGAGAAVFVGRAPL